MAVFYIAYCFCKVQRSCNVMVNRSHAFLIPTAKLRSEKKKLRKCWI